MKTNNTNNTTKQVSPDIKTEIDELRVLITPEYISIPNKVEHILRNSKIKRQLQDIHKDEEVAIELCLMFCSFLSSTVYKDETTYWKALNSTILNNSLRPKGSRLGLYKKIIDVLTNDSNFSRGALIQINETVGYLAGSHSKQYKLADRITTCGLTHYVLQTNLVKELHLKRYYEQISVAVNNPIAKYLLTEVYPNVTLPTKSEMLEEAKRLIENKTEIKGRKIRFLGNTRRDKINTKKYIIVEDQIDIFNHLTLNGTRFMIPSIAYQNGGGRVFDSLNLIPTWIRGLLKINGNKIVESDYTCLHPNIANTLYGENQEQITHEDVAGKLNSTKAKIKKNHLAFFNQTVTQIYHSSLLGYYQKHHPMLLQNVINDKKLNGHKSVTKKLFSTEVQLMTKVIEELSENGKTVIYVFDALYCNEDDLEIVELIMNQKAREMNINTGI